MSWMKNLKSIKTIFFFGEVKIGLGIVPHWNLIVIQGSLNGKKESMDVQSNEEEVEV